ncbi:MAG: hypothetical protein ACLQIB_04600 [Isosphaeraceae bacterium]
MIHIATVHWNDARWIDIQDRYFHEFLSEEFRVYAFLNGIGDVAAYRDKFFYASTEPIESHAIKLNLLADIIYAYSESDDDLIMFIDGDAFPVGDVVSFARRAIGEFPMLAVQRLENLGDPQPHPCFCMTTVGFWKRLGGDWKSGYEWRNSDGESVTDVGGNLLGLCEREGVRWLPLHRSNRLNLHPIWFGVYHDLVYHHGAAFRTHPCSRLEASRVVDMSDWPFLTRMQVRIIGRLIHHFKLDWLEKYCPLHRKFYAMIEENRQLGGEVFRALEKDQRFFERFIGSASAVSEAPSR